MGANHAISGAAVWVALTAPAVTIAVPALTITDGWTVPAFTLPLTTGLFPMEWPIVLYGALVAAGSTLWPDIDTESSTVGQIPIVGDPVTRGVGRLFGGHRHGTHGLPTWVAYTFLVAALVSILGLIPALQLFGTGSSAHWGLFAVATLDFALALKAIRSIWFVRSWLIAFILGALLALFIATTDSGDGFKWFVAASSAGYLTHILGDSLTVGGVPFLWPWIPKPPEWWQRTPVLNRCWQPNGYMGIPILGVTGGWREWVLGTALTVYVLLVCGNALNELLPQAVRALLAGAHL